jgi:hypothetical protein
MRTKTYAFAAALVGGLGLSSAAIAAPIGPSSAQGLAGKAIVEDVAYGCGRGFVPNRFGYCRPVYGYVGPRRFDGPHWGGPRRYYGGYGAYGGYHRHPGPRWYY